MDISKKIVTDENQQPVAVQIDYADWLEIERVLDLESTSAASQANEETKQDESSLNELADAAAPHWQGGDGLEYQRRIRDEWTRPWDPEAEEGQLATT